MLEMKKIRSKKLFGELVNELRPFMNDEGLEVLDYFGDPENINAFKLGELKEDLVKSIVPANFTNLEDFLDVAQNIGIKVEGLDTETVEKIEKVEISNDNQTESKVYSDDEQKIVSYVSNMLGVSEEKIEIYTVS